MCNTPKYAKLEERTGTIQPHFNQMVFFKALNIETIIVSPSSKSHSK